MFHKLRPRLSFANVMSCIAVFIALGSGSAVALSGVNTVFSDDIVDGEVRTPDLRDAAVTERKLAGGAVTSDKFRDNNLKSRDVLDNTLTGADIDESTLTNIGGGGPAGGVLAGSYPNPGFATSVNKLVPVAVVLVGADGAVASEAHRAPVTGTPSAVRDSGGIYELTLPGYSAAGNDFAVCTLRDSAGEINASVEALAGQIVVFTYASAGGLDDRAFQCAVYDL